MRAIWDRVLALIARGVGARTTAQQPKQLTVFDELMSEFYKDPRPERLIGFLEQFQTAAVRPQTKRWHQLVVVFDP